MRKLFCTLLITVAATCCYAQSAPDEKAKVILVRVVEMVGVGKYDSEVNIAYGDGKFENIDLENISAKGYPVDNMDKINLIFKRLFAENYELVDTYPCGGGGTVFIFKLK